MFVQYICLRGTDVLIHDKEHSQQLKALIGHLFFLRVKSTSIIYQLGYPALLGIFIVSSVFLYVSLYLCLYPLSLPNLTLNILPADPPAHLSLSPPPSIYLTPLPLSFQIRNSLLRLIFGWTNSFIIQIIQLDLSFISIFSGQKTRWSVLSFCKQI